MEQRLIAQKQSAGFIKRAVVMKLDDYWVVVVVEENGTMIKLTLQRLEDGKESVRKFATLDAAANVLRKMGISKFKVFS